MPNKLSLRSDKNGIWIYILFNLFFVFAFLFLVVRDRRIYIDSDLLNMVPKSSSESRSDLSEKELAVSAADDALSDTASRMVVILASHEDFSRAKAVAETAYERLSNSRNFSSLSLYSNQDVFSGMTEFLHKYRFNLMDKNLVDQLSTKEGAETFSTNAIAKAYSGFALFSMEDIAEDPFLFSDYNFNHYISIIHQLGLALSPKDGVIAAQMDGRWYVMIRGQLNEAGARLANGQNGVADIYEACSPLEKDGNRFVYFGTPFHSYESSMSASSEITIITVLSLLVVAFILIFVFRTFEPILFSVFSIAISVACGFCATYFLFHKIHVLSLVFSTSLIGCCIDYSLHFFTNWKADASVHSGYGIKQKIFRGLSLSLMSTVIGYVCLFFTPFDLLKQVAVFSTAGILSAYLASVCVYPVLRLPNRIDRKSCSLQDLLKKCSFLEKRSSKNIPCIAFAVVCILAVVFCHKNVVVKNDISHLYKMKGRLLDDTLIAGKIFNMTSSARFIISGDTVEEVLEKDEKLCIVLKLKNIDFMATSLFIPSLESQKDSIQAARNMIPYVEHQFDMLGFDKGYVDKYKKNLEIAKNNLLEIGSSDLDFLQDTLSSLWIGKVGSKYYSLVVPSNVKAGTVGKSVSPDAAFEEIAAGFDGVYYSNKVSDINSNLDKLTRMVLVIFACALIVVLCILKFFYSWKQVAKISVVCFLSLLSVVSVSVVFEGCVDFFAVTGIALVFGLGLDYVIYMMENKENSSIESFAVFLSFITTALSFGTLVFSSFLPVHLIGQSILTGLVCAFLCSVF